MPITEELIVEFLIEHDLYTAEDLEAFSDQMDLLVNGPPGGWALVHRAPEAIQ